MNAARRIAAVEACLSGQDTPARDLERALAVDAWGSLASFVQQLWHVLEPGTPLEWGWHLDLICSELERVTSGETRELVICIPPGFMKSLIGSVYWLAWWQLRDPTHRALTLSSSDDLAIRDSWKMRMVLRSDWYRRLVATCAEQRGTPVWTMSKDQDQKVNFVNTQLGGRQCFSTGGSVTGHRGRGYLVDDPHQVTDVLGEPERVAAALDRAHQKIDVVLPSRVNDQRTAWRVTIQQRVHEDDAAGRQIRRGVRALILPMHAYELDDPWRHPQDSRAPGELLDPVRFPEAAVAALAARLEEYPGQAEAQLEQRPIPAKGGMFKRAWMNQVYPWDPQRPPKPWTEIVQTVDATFKKTKTGAFVSIQTWGRLGWTGYYLLDEVHARMGYVDTRQAMRDAAGKWNPAAVLVELKANGEALVDDLRSEIPQVIGFMPDKYGDKVARAQLSTPAWQAGMVWLPDAGFFPTVGDFRNELASFPGGLAKDRVDAKSQLFLWWQERRGAPDHQKITAGINALLGGS